MSVSSLSSVIRFVLPISALLLGASAGLPLSTAAAAEANPFDQLKGDWKGGGTVTKSDGSQVKVACKATYDVTGNKVVQNLRCAGNDYNIDTKNKMTFKAGKLSGSWYESTYDATGGVSGTANDNLVHARISGDKFSGRMSISVSSDGHAINIIQQDKNSGVYRPVAALALHR